MKRLHLGLGTPEDFFAAGRRIAPTADRGEPIPEICNVTFEDVGEVLALLTRARMAVFRAVNTESASIAAIAARLHRNLASVKRDVDALGDARLLSLESLPDDAAGDQAIVRAKAVRVDLHVTL